MILQASACWLTTHLNTPPPNFIRKVLQRINLYDKIKVLSNYGITQLVYMQIIVKKEEKKHKVKKVSHYQWSLRNAHWSENILNFIILTMFTIVKHSWQLSAFTGDDKLTQELHLRRYKPFLAASVLKFMRVQLYSRTEPL